MPTILGELKSACLEVLASDPAGPTQGRIWYNSTEGRIKCDDGAGIRALLRNDLKLVIGNSVTAATNVRLNRAATALLQILPGNDATAEGSLSSTLAQLSSRLENYTNAGKPAPGNAGRLIYVTDLNELQFDDGSTWNTVGAGVQTGSNLGGFAEVFKARVVNDMQFRTLQSSDSSLTVTENSNDIDITLAGTPFGTQEFTSSGSFVVPDGVTRVQLLASGGGAGGGGGGGRDSSSGTVGGGGGSGGGGASPLLLDLAVVPAETLTVTIGAGGTGGAAGAADTNGSVGTDGSDTTILRGSTVIARLPGATNNGLGGIANSVGGAGGAAAVAGATSDQYAPLYLISSLSGAGGNVAGGTNAQGSSGGNTTSAYGAGTGGFGGRNTGSTSEGVGGGGGAGGSGYADGGHGGHGGGRENYGTGAVSVIRASNITTVTLGGAGATIWGLVPNAVGDQIDFAGFTSSSFNGTKTILTVGVGTFTVSDAGIDESASVIGAMRQASPGQAGTYGSGGGGGGGGSATLSSITDNAKAGGAGGDGFAIFSWVEVP